MAITRDRPPAADEEGARYAATVPETLDLAERASLAINALAGALMEEFDYEYVWLYFYAPPFGSLFHGDRAREQAAGIYGDGLLRHHAGEWVDSNGRAALALLWLREVTGSDRFREREEAMLASYLSRLGDDGLLYNAPYRADAPWRKGGEAGCRAREWRTDDDVAMNGSPCHALILMALRYLRDGDPDAYRLGDTMARRLREIAIYRDDYAYFPATTECGADFAYFRRTGWPDTREAASDMDSPEGAVTCYIAIYVHALCRWYSVSGDAATLDLAARLVRYILKPQFWTGNIDSWARGMDLDVFRSHGGLPRKPAAHYKGHLSGLAYTFHGLIEYAIAANDATVKEWVRQGYEYTRNLGLARIGMWGENIANNLLAAVAVKLSDAGVGDYWEDVDQYVRNGVVEDQFIDLELIRAERRARGLPETDPHYPAERFLGNLRWGGMIDKRGTLDPTQNGVMAAGPYLEPFYYLWEAITRYDAAARSASVNLLLNRAAAWLDVDSYLPYEGKVVIRNKRCRHLSVRIPCWVDRTALACRINDGAGAHFWTGNYLVATELEPGDVVTITFPMVETVETCYLQFWDAMDVPWHAQCDALPTYILHLKGNTCVEVEFPNRAKFATGYATPDLAGESGYPVYRRERYREDRAPMREVVRYISPRVLPW